MAFFNQSPFSNQLFMGSEAQSDRGQVWLVLPRGHGEPISLEQALHDDSLRANFAFSAAPIVLDDADAASQFVQTILKVAGTVAAARSILWLRDSTDISPPTVALLGIAPDGTFIQGGLGGGVLIEQILQFKIPNGTRLELASETQVILSTVQGNKIGLAFNGDGTLRSTGADHGMLDFSGPYRGCVRYTDEIQQQSLREQLFWGFQFSIPTKQPVRSAIHEYLPIAGRGDSSNNGASPTDQVQFAVSIDLSDPLNAQCPTTTDRTALTFTGTTQKQNGQQIPTRLASYYRTIYGHAIDLLPLGIHQATSSEIPARLVFALGEQVKDGTLAYHSCPVGDYALQVGGRTGHFDLLCGLTGTEFLAFQAGTDAASSDRLRFAARQPAFAANYPFPEASPVGKPLQSGEMLLKPNYLTAWGTVVRPPDSGTRGQIPYVAQPKGSSLYGRDELIHSYSPQLFGFKDPSVVLPDTDFTFPIPPYAGAIPSQDGVATFNKQQIEAVEREVLGPTRRDLIGKQNPSQAASKMECLTGVTTNQSPTNSTTPTGLIATVDGGGRFTKVLLGQNLHGPQGQTRQMAFCQLQPKLQQAMQTNQLLLVVANPTELGAMSGGGDGTCDSKSQFFNQMNIEDWSLEADVGQNAYNDYHNVMIFKGRKGPLYDPKYADRQDGSKEPSNLVSNPNLWTQRETFASPSTQDDPTPDPTQQIILSGWLQKYFQEASQQTGNVYFEKFNAIAKDPNWTGILVLRMNIAEIPSDLAGITAGVSAPERFNAHHFGIEIGQVQNDPGAPQIELSDSSSMFGLIYYVDPDFQQPDEGQPAEPIAPAPGAIYDFRLLTLKVLFENTAVSKFESLAQLTLNRLFDMSVTHMGSGGNGFNTIVLQGGYQNNNGNPVYSLSSTADNTFYFDSNIFNKIEIDSAQLTTRSSGYLFDLDKSFSDALNQGGEVPPELRDVFQTHHISLSEAARIKPLESNRLWDIDDGDSQYQIESDLKLQVYGDVVSWFGLSGFLDFQVVAQGVELDKSTEFYPFDILSFGNNIQPRSKPTDPIVMEDQLRKGLRFSGLGISMRFPKAAPTTRELSFVVDEMRFDTVTSTPRVGSLFRDFALELEGLDHGTPDVSPPKDYLGVITDARLNGVEGSPWYGLRYRLNMGSPGELAGKIDLTSQLFTGWSSNSRGNSGYQAQLGLQLPGTGGGAKLISLQTVLKLSIGLLRLTRAKTQSGDESFMLMLTDIALKLLGLLKIPPGGSTLFYLFGNPQGDGKAKGLGWYAMYNQDQAKQEPAPELIEK